MDFPQEVFSSQKTIFKKGAISWLAGEVLEFGEKGLIVHGRSFDLSGRKEETAKQFSGNIKTRADFSCRGTSKEPVLREIKEIIKKAKSIDAKWIAGIGGGSVIDLAKAAAGLFNAKEQPGYYQEGGKLKERGIPFIAVPTTAGTGAEVTRNAVIVNEEKRCKLSIREDSFLARKIILDPCLLQGLPKKVISYSGMDAFVQAYEAFTSRNATWYSDSFALKAIELINNNIFAAYDKQDIESLSALLLGSHFAGIALSCARLGVIHGIAHPLGVIYDFPHGLICAVCFIPSIRINKAVMGDKYGLIGDVIGIDLEKRIQELLTELNIISPFKGLQIIEKDKILKETLESGSTAANPKKIEVNDIEFIIREIF